MSCCGPIANRCCLVSSAVFEAKGEPSNTIKNIKAVLEMLTGTRPDNMLFRYTMWDRKRNAWQHVESNSASTIRDVRDKMVQMHGSTLKFLSYTRVAQGWRYDRKSVAFNTMARSLERYGPSVSNEDMQVVLENTGLDLEMGIYLNGGSDWLQTLPRRNVRHLIHLECVRFVTR